MFYYSFKLIIYTKFSLHLFFMQQRNITLFSCIYGTLSFYSKCYEKANRGVNVNEKMPC